MRSVRRVATHEVLVRMLCEKNHSKSGRSLFPSMRELLCFCAVLGFQVDRRIRLEGKTLEVDARIWERSDTAVDLVYLLALAGTRDINLLHVDRDDDALTVFEEYANGGLEVLSGWFAANAGDTDGDVTIINGFRALGLLGNAPPPVEAATIQVTF